MGSNSGELVLVAFERINNIRFTARSFGDKAFDH
jgi:hypothetical protein